MPWPAPLQDGPRDGTGSAPSVPCIPCPGVGEDGPSAGARLSCGPRRVSHHLHPRMSFCHLGSTAAHEHLAARRLRAISTQLRCSPPRGDFWDVEDEMRYGEGLSSRSRGREECDGEERHSVPTPYLLWRIAISEQPFLGLALTWQTPLWSWSLLQGPAQTPLTFLDFGSIPARKYFTAEVCANEEFACSAASDQLPWRTWSPFHRLGDMPGLCPGAGEGWRHQAGLRFP